MGTPRPPLNTMLRTGTRSGVPGSTRPWRCTPRAGRRGASRARSGSTGRRCRAGCGRASCRPGGSGAAAATLTATPSTSTGRWREGCRNAAQLWREVQRQGFRGRLRAVQRWASHRRGTDPTASGAGRAAAWPMPSKRRASWLVVADPERTDATERRFVDALLARSPELAGLIGLARRFSTMVREQQADRLDGWLAAAKGSALAGFADALARDLDAVRAALTLPWSTGPVEGQISRLKTLKRAMCGRAGFELLRRRVLLAA